MKLQHIIEARYAEPTRAWRQRLRQDPKLNQFVNANIKLFEKLYKEMELSFHVFYDTTIENMDDQPDEYDTRDRDPREIVEYWWDQYQQQGVDDLISHVITHFEKIENSGMFDDVVQAMGDRIAQTARQIVENQTNNRS
ncbi:hypothetical protein LCGC14_2371170 [marine sediment metagenome]|uniref:Uncharacterized protein n=1 Tax=marine sediment metagenome TaxID=412755 RepID=A0A0F9EG88_9ZZZZ